MIRKLVHSIDFPGICKPRLVVDAPASRDVRHMTEEQEKDGDITSPWHDVGRGFGPEDRGQNVKVVIVSFSLPGQNDDAV